MLFIQNSRVIDPKTGTDAVLDLIVENGKIVDMGENPGRALSGSLPVKHALPYRRLTEAVW